MTDFGAANDEGDVGTESFEDGDKLGGLGDVPDVDAKADDFRFVGKDFLGDVERALVDIEFEEPGARLEVAEVGEEVAQAKGAMRVPGVERGKNDVGHGDKIAGRGVRIELALWAVGKHHAGHEHNTFWCGAAAA